jgi:hypothetical protein
VSATLIALCCLLAPLGTVAAWAAYGLTDTGRYVRAMAPLAGDPAVREEVARTVAAEVRGTLPVPTPLRSFVDDAIHSFTRTEAFRAGWDAANRVSHDAVLSALRDDHRASGPVTVDLAPVTAQIKHRLSAENVPLAGRIPVERTEISVLPERDLDRLRKGFHMLEVAAFWLPSAAVACAVAGIALATRRRRALTATALGTALGGALLALAVAVGRRLTLSDVPADVSRPAAGAVYDALTASLRTASWLLLALGLAVAGAAWLSGRCAPLAQRRQASAAPAPAPEPRPTRARA